MAKIELLFGAPNLFIDEIEIEKDAYAWDSCRETAVIRRFHSLINRLSITKKNGDNFFEVSINLSTNFSTLRYVYVVSDILADEKVKIEGGRIND